MRVFSIEGKGLKLENGKDVESFVEQIKKAENLEEIRLNGNSFAPAALETLSEALKSHSNLKTAQLHDIFTGRLKDTIPPSLKALTDCLIDKQHLSLIDLSDNAFGPIGAESLVDLISGNRNLQVIRLNNNGLGPKGGNFIANALNAVCEKNESEGSRSNLKCIVIGRNRLEDGSAPALGEALGRLSSLEQVCLPQNGIRPDGIIGLVKGLRKCHELKHLDLQDNTFTESAALELAQSLKHWPKLEVLNIGDCLLKAKGCLFVLKEIQKLDLPLVTLNLGFNEMDEQGALLVAECIPKFKSIKSIVLNGNEFNPEGTAAEAIKSNLERCELEDVMDSWSDMEYDSEEEEENESEDVSPQSEEELVDAMNESLKIQ